MDSDKFLQFSLITLFLLLIPNILLALFNLGFFNTGSAEYIGGGSAIGFTGLNHPKSISYRNTTFTASFANSYQTVNITKVSAYEFFSDSKCSLEAIDGSDLPYAVGSGRIFNVSIICPHKTNGEEYNLAMVIEYEDSDKTGTDYGYEDTGIIQAYS